MATADEAAAVVEDVFALSRFGFMTWLVAHFVINAAWFLGPIFQRFGVMWIMSSAMIFSHGAFFFLVAAWLDTRGGRGNHGRYARALAVAILTCALPALLFVGWYMIELIEAKLYPGTATGYRLLLVTQWQTYPAGPIILLVLIGMTIGLHLIDIVVSSWMIYHYNTRINQRLDSLEPEEIRLVSPVGDR